MIGEGLIMIGEWKILVREHCQLLIMYMTAYIFVYIERTKVLAVLAFFLFMSIFLSFISYIYIRRLYTTNFMSKRKYNIISSFMLHIYNIINGYFLYLLILNVIEYNKIH